MTHRTAGPYTLTRLQEMLGLSRRVITSMIDAGFVTPARGARNEYRFSFQDVVLLRTAHRLQAAGIPPRKVLRSLKELKARLPAQAPLAGLRVTAVGSDVAVREGGHAWAADSGQFLLDFEVAPAAGGEVAFIERPAANDSGAAQPRSAEDWFALAVHLEAGERDRADEAYRRAIELAPARSDAYLNLGVMLAEAGRHAEAVALYDEAIERCPPDALLQFNRAVALEDSGRRAAALEGYAACLAIDPRFADAHYNAARLHDEIGQPQSALKHYSAYRRLARSA